MYWLDTTILIGLALACLLGARTGFLTQVARLLAVSAALGGTVFFNPWVAHWMQEALFSDAPAWVSRVVAYVLMFLAIYLLLWLLASLLQRGVEAARLQWLNRALGAVLSAGKAALLFGVILYALSSFAPDTVQGPLEKSTLAPMLNEGVGQLVAAIPAEYRDDLWGQLPMPPQSVELPGLPFSKK